ncbi:MAG: hypothetical protein K9K80_02260 [Spirochaetia bacterium]|nr:hypothetical protein [Spirochaetia bacterium]MCF7952910.1 hypothetical protein [Spirochaetales bacterium]
MKNSIYPNDIGKLIVEKSILDKPSKLSPAEFNEIMKHPYYTRKTINMIGLDDDSAFWAGNHHEKLDGSGYPNGLKGKDLDFESRAIGFLDVFQALTESRTYRNAFKDNEAFEIIETMVNVHKLDGQVVKIGKKIFLPF